MRKSLVALLLYSIGNNVFAADVSVSGFATLGGAMSDKSYNYQSFINENGTLRRDSLFGLQTDIKFNEEWSATVQGKLAQSIKSDTGIDGTLTWAFLSYRPTNDWLIRAGKLRLPMYINNENMDVGVTYDMARLPSEMYNIAPAVDYKGISITKTWDIGDNELAAEVYAGKVETTWRIYARDDLSALGGFSKGANFFDVMYEAKGAALTYTTENDSQFKVSIHDLIGRRKDGGNIYGDFVGTAFGPSIISYNKDTSSGVSSNRALLWTIGADLKFDDGYRVVAEYGSRETYKMPSNPNANMGYIAVFKTVDKWTPYLSAAMLKSKANTKGTYLTIDSEQSSGMTAAGNRNIADSVTAFDQYTYSLGTSYSISPTQKIKAEVSQVRIGAMSSFVDNPTTQRVSNERINVYSISYSIAF